jgi:hypothetical protein
MTFRVEINKGQGGAELVYELIKTMKDGWDELVLARVR